MNNISVLNMTTYYSKPSYPVFVGGRRQVGGGVFGSLARSFLPFLKRAAVPVLKEVGKGALELGANVASDALRGENIGQSFKERAKDSAIKFLDGVTSVRPKRKRKRKRTQVGSGRVTKQTKRRRVRRRTSTVRKPKNPRKRRRKSKAPHIAAKRRRTSYI